MARMGPDKKKILSSLGCILTKHAAITNKVSNILKVSFLRQISPPHPEHHCVAAVLRALVGGSITQLFPSLQNIFVEGLEPSGVYQDNLGQFVAARHLSGHAIVVSVWGQDSNMKST